MAAWLVWARTMLSLLLSLSPSSTAPVVKVWIGGVLSGMHKNLSGRGECSHADR